MLLSIGDRWLNQAQKKPGTIPPTRDVVEPAGPSRRIKQERGRKTYDALISTAFKLLKDREFEAISISELSRAAGYSVGAFYARFRSKDEFFDALVADHLEERRTAQLHLMAEESDDALIPNLIENIVTYYWNRRKFWRAALIRSIREPSFWDPIRASSHRTGNLLIERLGERIGRRLTDAEENNVRFGLQIVLGTINNAIINRPGPVFIGQVSFIENLTQAFLLVSEYEKFLTEKSARSR